MSTLTSTIVLPSFDAPDGVNTDGMTLADLDASSSESAVASIIARANYYLAVTALTVYTRVNGGESSATIIGDLAADETTGKPRNRQYVSRLALIGEAVSHGVTDALAFRTAMRGLKVTDVRVMLSEHVNDDGTVDEAELIDAMTAPAKAEKAEKTPQESFDNRIKSASQTLAAAVSQFTADDADLIISDEVRAMLAVIASGVATLTV